MPKGRVSRAWIRPRMAFSAHTKMGPTATRVTSTVTNTETSGVKEVEHLGNDLVQALLEEGQNGTGDNDGDHMALIADALKAVHTGNDGNHGLYALGGNRVGALQRGVNERTADDGTQIRVGAKGLGGGVADQDLQNAKGCARDRGRQSCK